MDPADTIRAYYEAIDDGTYEELEALLAPEFTHERPDRTLIGRDAFVSFMRDDRPMTDTTHQLRTVVADGDRGVAEGRLLDADGEVIFGFADVHELGTGRIRRLRTYTD